MFTAFPIIDTFLISLTKSDGITGTFVGLKNYAYVLESHTFWHSVYNTFFLTIFQLIISVPLGFIIGSFINSVKWGQAFFKVLFFVPYITPLVATTMIFLLLLNPSQGAVDYLLHLIGVPKIAWLADPHTAKWGLIFLGTWTSLGFIIIISMANLQAIPTEHYEAAKIDGANGMQRWMYITIPSMRGTFVFFIVTGWIGGLQRFTEAKATSTPLKVVIIGSYSLNNSIDPVTGHKILGLNVLEQTFDRENPGANLQFIVIPWTNYIAKMQTMITGDQADVYQAAGQQAAWAAQGLLQPLEPFIKKSKFNLNVYLPHQVSGWKVVGKGDKSPQIYGLPVVGDTEIMMYDKKIFQQWHVSPPSLHPTMAEILTKAREITGINAVTHQQNYGAFFDATGQGHGAFFLEDLAVAQGGTWGTGYSPSTLKLKFNSAPWINGLTWLNQVAKYAPPGLLSGQGAETFGTPNNDIGMMLFTGPGALPIKTAQQDGFINQLGITEVFKNKHGSGGVFFGSPFSIAKNSTNKNLAWKFIEFSSSSYYQKFMYDNFGNLPVIRSAKKWPELQKNKNDWNVIFEALSSMEPHFIPWSTQPRFYLDGAIQEVLSGQKSPAAALNQAERQSMNWVQQQK